MQLFEEAIDLLKEVRESADCDTFVKIDHEKNEKFHKQALSAGKILKETVCNFPNLAGFTQIIDEMRG
ncbi:MAG: hypothetical protein DRP33_03445 [Thermotogae bacterium]|nr:MAG: hypothetical protein DRP33_03445 [Thermotogota bacterium]